MDTNRFKASHDFSNIQKNLSNNRKYHAGNADIKNQSLETSKNGFVTHAQKTAKEVWMEIQEMNSGSWNKHKDDKK